MTIKVKDERLQKLLFDKIIITSPEVSLIQITKNFPIHRIMLLAMEVCGSYALSFSLDKTSKNNSLKEKGFVSNIPAVTNIKKLYTACSYFSGSRLGDIKKFKNILSWIAPGSASPAESKIFVMLCGPRKIGCFQINKLELNKEIKLSRQSTMLCGFSKIRPDFSCEEKKVAIEYDSKLFHEDVENNQQDKKRSLALMHDGWKVITIVPSEMHNYETFSTIAKDILRIMGQDTRIRNKNFKINSTFVYCDIWR